MMMPNSKVKTDTKFRHLSEAEIKSLESSGCTAEKWDDVLVTDSFDLNSISNVHFLGPVTISPGVVMRNVRGGIGNCHIGENTRIENVDRIDFEPEAQCGIGTPVNVLDETGSRPVIIFPGLSSQVATLIARDPKWYESNFSPHLQEAVEKMEVSHSIGENSIIKDSGRLLNVSVGNEVVIEGARSLVNGTIINNSSLSKPLTYIGHGVDAENFIVEDARLESGCIIRNCYVGQGVEIGKGFSAHDSLFFANSTFENGEACALLAGPYTVSMHKGSLLIGCQTSFMNAGSSTNESNHMYKLGPVHWGLLERGVKTSSGAYIMFGARIGAFSMIMGAHKTHPDSSSFPFSYLFGDEKGATIVVPGAMLRSCGLMRDEKKWPTRDRRIKRRLPLHDNITFNVLNPYTVDSMLKALDKINELLSHPTDDDLYLRHKGMKFTRAALERAKLLYTVAIYKYLSLTLPELKWPEPLHEEPPQWVDLGGHVMKRETLEAAKEAKSLENMQKIFDDAFESFKDDELKWIASRFGEKWRKTPQEIIEGAKRFDSIVEEDRREYLENIAHENKMLAL